MSAQAMSNLRPTKAVVSVAEMARMVGLSRARFYQLQRAGVFPPPCYSITTRRPIYIEEQQQVCLEVRRRNCGINGQPVLFYARRIEIPQPSRPRPTIRSTARPQPSPHAELIEALKALGLESVTAPQVEAAIRACFPHGINGEDEGQVIRSVFRHLRQTSRQYSSDSVGR